MLCNGKKNKLVICVIKQTSNLNVFCKGAAATSAGVLKPE